MARIHSFIDGALSEMEHRQVFRYYIAQTVRNWSSVLDNGDRAEIANELRAAPVLKGQASVHWCDGETFGSQAWWSS